jgi:hypothetical protein
MAGMHRDASNRDGVRVARGLVGTQRRARYLGRAEFEKDHIASANGCSGLVK